MASVCDCAKPLKSQQDVSDKTATDSDDLKKDTKNKYDDKNPSLPDIENKEQSKTNSSTTQPSKQDAYDSPSKELSSFDYRLQKPIDPYTEDNAAVQREADSLRLPPRRYQANGTRHGPAIGTQRATDLHDFASVATLLEAAKFQPIRHQNQPKLSKHRLIVTGNDLRSYRRLPVPEQMLVMVLDYTSVRDLDWQTELLPYLRWAYVERTSLCLIRVGAADAPSELRAERILARNFLVPRLHTALEAAAGKATPLAHGLELALQTLRRALQHGRSTVERAKLVVMTDGRGNVPLEASRLNKIIWPVKRQGIEDALKIAKQIGIINNVKLEVIFLNPNPKQYTLLPWDFKEALGADMFLFSSAETANQTKEMQ
jgi:magnesium chelatase subunit D